MKEVFDTIKREEIVYTLYPCRIGMCYDHELRQKRNNHLILHADIGDRNLPDNIEQHLEEGVKELRWLGFKIDYIFEKEVKYEPNKGSTMH